MQARPQLTIDSSYKEICRRLSSLTTPNICDALPEVRLMEKNKKAEEIKIKPVGENNQFIGRAYTVDSNLDSLSIMQALDDLQAFLAVLNPSADDIVPTMLLVASCGAPYALVGGFCANAAKKLGYGAVLSDGPCRDIREICDSGIPFFAKGTCAISGPKQRVGKTRVTVQCGGVEVEPGDIIFADVDGVVVLNKKEAVAAVSRAEEVKTMEDGCMQDINNGARFKDICNIDEHVANIEAGRPSRLQLKRA